MPLKMNRIRRKERPHPGSLKSWMQAFRLHFVPTSLFPALLGTVIAWVSCGQFHLLNFAMVMIGMALHHIALNMIDDVYDYLHDVDRCQDEEKNPYAGGSGVLTKSLLPVGRLLGLSLLFYTLSVSAAVYLALSVGWSVLIFTGIGMFSSFFYSAPPLRYGYRGFGELSLLINFGPVICLGAFYVQCRSIAWEPAIVSLIPGFLMWSMIVINEIPDYEEDRQAGKLNLVARFGKKSGVLLYAAGLIGAYATILLAASFGVASIYILLGVLSMPVALQSFRLLRENYRDKLKMAPANLAAIKVHALTLSGLILGYVTEGAMAKWF